MKRNKRIKDNKLGNKLIISLSIILGIYISIYFIYGLYILFSDLF